MPSEGYVIKLNFVPVALVAIAAAAIAVPAIVVTHSAVSRRTPRRLAALPPPRVVPQAELPPVEPVAFVDLPPDEARAFNATVPFSSLPNPAARPFHLAGPAEDRARATDCLAAGILYEAGDDSVGERAVAQVVLNRLRHPAFPKTVCGVVFEGAERTTGCQFTFSCDGALTRWKPTETAWARARAVATMALGGAVYRPVGYSTHYHTDWVVPYWQSSLDKVARVGTHLFFRWSGWWGTPPAFNRQVSPIEPTVMALAALSPAHGGGATLTPGDSTALDAAPGTGSAPLALPGAPDTFVIALDAKAAPDSYHRLALAACGDRPHCIVMGWTDRTDMPIAGVPLPAQLDAMAFSYLRDRAGGLERALWNCTRFARPAKTQCMKRQTPRTDPPAVALPAPAPTPDMLAGVRRRTDNAPPAAGVSQPQD